MNPLVLFFSTRSDICREAVLAIWDEKTKKRKMMTSLIITIICCHLHAAFVQDSVVTTTPDGTKQRRLALIVGIDNYKYIDDKYLGGVEDARSFNNLLTGKGGYGFPEENVTVLLNEQATLGSFIKTFEQDLTKRANPDDDIQDIVVIFFAGHGGRVADGNGDEADGYDETFLFHDSRHMDVPDLIDDRFHLMLQKLHARVDHMVLISDSCHAATRDRNDSVLARSAGVWNTRQNHDSGLIGDGSRLYAPKSLSKLVTIAASGDNGITLTRKSGSIFTGALVDALADVPAKPLTYRQLEARLARLVTARGNIKPPFLQGRLNTEVFGLKNRKRPLFLDVKKINGKSLTLKGMLPGLGKNAELRIYDSLIEGPHTNDPTKALATAIVTRVEGPTTFARIEFGQPDKIKTGDFAVLSLPGSQHTRLKFAIRSAGLPGGVPTKRANQILETISEYGEAAFFLEYAEPPELELRLNDSGKLIVVDPLNRVRNTFQNKNNEAPNAVEALWRHARQKALLQLSGEGGSLLSDDASLKVRVIPPEGPDLQHPCAADFWDQARLGESQTIPLCHSWQIEVEMKPMGTNLFIGGFVLSSDGGIYGFPCGGPVNEPCTGRIEELASGSSFTFKTRKETFVGNLPLNTTDYILVFGTREPIPWHLLTQTAVERSTVQTEGVGSSLYAVLDRYLTPNRSRSGILLRKKENIWTMSMARVRVSANPVPGLKPLRKFDIRPYLPDRQDTKLFRLIRQIQHFPAQIQMIDGSQVAVEVLSKAGFTKGARAIEQHLRHGRSIPEKFAITPDQLAQMGDIHIWRTGDGSGFIEIVLDGSESVSWYCGWFGEKARARDIGYGKLHDMEDWRSLGLPNMRLTRIRLPRVIETLKTTLIGEAALAGACDSDKDCGRK